jgi:hypothetical protein
MSIKSQSRVLIVDDRPDLVGPVGNALKALHVRVVVCTPEDVSVDDLRRADLVLVDLDLEDWLSGVTPGPISRRPPDGLALATLLRRHLVDQADHSPTGFAILTGQVDTISKPFPPEHRLHLLAESNNLEWIFLKGESDLAMKVTSLALAIHSIPQTWRDGIQSVEEIAAALGLDKKILPLQRYEEVIQYCHPPINELTEWTHGLAFIRWFLQKILVYPCFLWDSYRLAARLRLDFDELERILNGDSRLKTRLSKLRYKGVLHDFDGPRWWRDAVELFLWHITDGDSQNKECILGALEKLAGEPIKSGKVERPIVCIDQNYRPISHYFSRDQVVRVQPDDWPAYADHAFMAIGEVASNERLRTLIVGEDRERVE